MGSNYISNYNIIHCGLPQGSILGPLLFLIYVNDLPNATDSHVTLFADDTNFHLVESNFKRLQNKINLEMDKFANSMACNKLSINHNKSSYMLIKKRNSTLRSISFQVILDGYEHEQQEYVKCFGIYLDNKLTWKYHVNEMCVKLSKVCGIFYKIRHFVPLSVLRIIYFSLFQSHLQYSPLNRKELIKQNFAK